MLVKAIRIGYYDHLRRYPEGHTHPSAGRPFTLSNPEHFSKKWMEKINEESDVTEKVSKEPEPRGKAKRSRDSDVI